MDTKKIGKFLGKAALKAGAAVGVLFAIYMVNGDSKLVEVLYDALYKYHHTKEVEDVI